MVGKRKKMRRTAEAFYNFTRLLLLLINKTEIRCFREKEWKIPGLSQQLLGIFLASIG
jgi:hypothetical protein